VFVFLVVVVILLFFVFVIVCRGLRGRRRLLWQRRGWGRFHGWGRRCRRRRLDVGGGFRCANGWFSGEGGSWQRSRCGDDAQRARGMRGGEDAAQRSAAGVVVFADDAHAVVFVGFRFVCGVADDGVDAAVVERILDAVAAMIGDSRALVSAAPLEASRALGAATVMSLLGTVRALESALVHVTTSRMMPIRSRDRIAPQAT